MIEFAEKLCTNDEEYLSYAEILESAGYKKEAATMYDQHGRKDKYEAYLKSNLAHDESGYLTLISFYKEQNQQDKACQIAQLGLKNCKGDLTEMFIILLVNAKKEKDENLFKKLYASAKRRKRVSIDKVNQALQNM